MILRLFVFDTKHIKTIWKRYENDMKTTSFFYFVQSRIIVKLSMNFQNKHYLLSNHEIFENIMYVNETSRNEFIFRIDDDLRIILNVCFCLEFKTYSNPNMLQSGKVSLWCHEFGEVRNEWFVSRFADGPFTLGAMLWLATRNAPLGFQVSHSCLSSASELICIRSDG